MKPALRSNARPSPGVVDDRAGETTLIDRADEVIE
jgi:hypothetical protein